MKTILPLLLLPFLLLALPCCQYENEPVDLAFYDLKSSLEQEDDFLDVKDNTSVTSSIVAIDYLEMEVNYPPNFNRDEISTPPRYLNAFSLTRLSTVTLENQNAQEQLERLLAANNSRLPKEDTFSDWFSPVRYQQNNMRGIENIPEGFGPNINL